MRSFLRDKDGDYSMTLLLLFLSFWPSTYAMLTRDSEEIFYAYIAAFTGLAINKQWSARNALASGESQTSSVQSTSTVTSSSVVDNQPLAGKGQPVRRSKRRAF